MKVIMFHSIGNDKSVWSRNYLSVPVEQFEGFFRFLVRNGYRTHFFDDWYDAQPSNKINDYAVVLTFDDGYLDNWVYLFPLLQKYGLKATIFINPGFVDPGANVRANMADIWEAQADASDLQSLGFLNWAEIKTMQDSGFVDIQSHSMSHDWLFSSERLIDLYTGQDDLDWISWVISPQTKYRYISESANASLTPFGYPVFENGRALGVRQFKPYDHFVAYSVKRANDWLKQFNSTISKRDMIAELIEYGRKNGIGEFESLDDQMTRYWSELFDSKRILEEKLGKPVDYLCWPGGGYNDLSVQMAWEAGYKASTVASWDSTSKFDNSRPNKRISRITISYGVSVGGMRHAPLKQSIMGLSLQAKSGNFYSKSVLRLIKAFFVVKGRLKWQ